MDGDDSELMQHVQQGRFEFFEELVSRYRPALLRVAASKLGDAAWAEDAVQEAFLAVFAARHTYRPELSFRTWLWTIMLNVCRRLLQRRRARPQEVAHSALQGSEMSPPEPADHETGLTQALWSERREQVAALLEKLPEVQADALRLRFYGGLKFDEIAAAMGCSLGGAKLRVRSGLMALAALLGDEAGEK